MVQKHVSAPIEHHWFPCEIIQWMIEYISTHPYLFLSLSWWGPDLGWLHGCTTGRNYSLQYHDQMITSQQFTGTNRVPDSVTIISEGEYLHVHFQNVPIPNPKGFKIKIDNIRFWKKENITNFGQLCYNTKNSWLYRVTCGISGQSAFRNIIWVFQDTSKII